MLIRSQDKTIIVNIDNAFSIAIRDINGAASIYVGSQGGCCIIAEYSTKAKAMKVLDMIQEAYMDFESAKITSTGLATAAYAISLNYDTPENVFDGINELKEYGDSIKELMVFQMPEDGRVEL